MAGTVSAPRQGRTGARCRGVRSCVPDTAACTAASSSAELTIYIRGSGARSCAEALLPSELPTRSLASCAPQRRRDARAATSRWRHARGTPMASLIAMRRATTALCQRSRRSRIACADTNRQDWCIDMNGAFEEARDDGALPALSQVAHRLRTCESSGIVRTSAVLGMVH